MSYLNFPSVAEVIGASGTPTLALGTAAGTGATASIIGTNMSGQITLNTGTGILASGVVLTMTFSGGFAYPNKAICSFAAANTSFAAVVSTIYISSTTTTTVVLSVTAGLILSTTYIGHYTVTGF